MGAVWATTTTTATRIFFSTNADARSCFTTTPQRGSRPSAEGRSACVGQREHCRLARLRRRWPPRSVPRATGPRTSSRAPEDDESCPSFECAENGGRNASFTIWAKAVSKKCRRNSASAHADGRSQRRGGRRRIRISGSLSRERLRHPAALRQ
jgi:hypothetical protein